MRVIMTKEELLKKVHNANRVIDKHGKSHKFSYNYVKVLLNDIELSVRELNNGTN